MQTIGLKRIAGCRGSLSLRQKSMRLLPPRRATLIRAVLRMSAPSAPPWSQARRQHGGSGGWRARMCSRCLSMLTARSATRMSYTRGAGGMSTLSAIQATHHVETLFADKGAAIAATPRGVADTHAGAGLWPRFVPRKAVSTVGGGDVGLCAALARRDTYFRNPRAVGGNEAAHRLPIGPLLGPIRPMGHLYARKPHLYARTGHLYAWKLFAAGYLYAWKPPHRHRSGLLCPR